MSDILKRSLTGAIFVVVMISAFVYSSYSAVVLLFILTLIGLKEFYQLFEHKKKYFPQKIMGIIGGAYIFLVFVGVHIERIDYFAYVSLVPLFLSVLIAELYRRKEEPITNLSLTLFAWLYIPILFFSMLLIRDYFPTHQWKYVVGMFVAVWSNDSFAYLTGRWLGKNKLFERISPKKTWEGTFGGILFATLFSVLYALILDLDLLFWGVAGVLIAIASIFGDLFESLLKRSAGVKDSGALMPGHGGVLDRFDAALFAAPVFFVWMMLYF